MKTVVLRNTFSSVIVVFVFVLENSQLSAEGLDVVNDLLLDEVEAHRNHSDAEEQVERAEGEALFAVFALLVGHQVAEADRRQRDETKVAAVEKRPALPVLTKRLIDELT